jgi:hypothetical protein
MDEEELKANVLGTLEPYFQIYTEVPGEHVSGKSFRLDAVVEPRRPEGWQNPEVALGIEFKDAMRLEGDTSNFTKWLGQCFDYSNTHWKGFGFLYLFACPSLIEYVPKGRDECQEQVARTLSHVMGQMGVGELGHSEWRGWTLEVHEGHRIWSESEGLGEGAHWGLEREFGSR